MVALFTACRVPPDGKEHLTDLHISMHTCCTINLEVCIARAFV